jgi:hypothetical protein
MTGVRVLPCLERSSAVAIGSLISLDCCSLNIALPFSVFCPWPY